MTSVLEKQEVKKVPPSNIAAERAVLAGLCQFGQNIYVDCCDILTDDCFVTDAHKCFYKTICSIYQDSTSCDIPSFVAKATMLGFGEFIKEKKQIDYVKALFEYGVKQENILTQAKVIRKLDVARKGQNLARQIYSELGNITGEETLDSIIDKLEGPVFKYSTSIDSDEDDKTEKIGKNVGSFIENWKSNPVVNIGVPSPWPTYNFAIGGGRRRGGVYLTAARPKQGKSTLSINDGLFLAKTGVPVLYLDTEMTVDGQMPRILACLSGIDSKEIETGQFGKNDFKTTKVTEAGLLLEKLPFYYRKISGKKFTEILSIIRRWIVQVVGFEDGRTNDCLVIYDYFKLMDSGNLSELKEYQELGFQMQSLTDFCVEYDFPCSAYVQLNRNGAEDPTSSDLSQSDRLLWFCSSLAILGRKTAEELAEEDNMHGNMKLIVAPEQRYGPSLDEGDWINLSFNRSKSKIDEVGTRFKQRPSDAFETEPGDED